MPACFVCGTSNSAWQFAVLNCYFSMPSVMGSTGGVMFLLILNDTQAQTLLARPLPTFCIGAALSLLMIISGASWYFLAGLLLPIVEWAVRFKLANYLGDRVLLAIAVSVWILHAALLAFAQNGTTSVAKLAVNLAYIGVVLVGVAAAGICNRIKVAGLDIEGEPSE
jgi:hypothetical protein